MFFLTLLIIICYNKKLVYWRRNQNIYPIFSALIIFIIKLCLMKGK
ncbi:hypothetical protein HMPREF0549_0844 [Limosilactobacillus vaginalis DSM 5837 = ATCC 49540]|uniref:Uncharacterized protein n=1 Tax=Limosilactobacillus vaginalis DSM 5837 = ATCC 49540 TaxID=1423814 RepID=C2ETQ8_9LACO|nr:hypothetical protein HMPREF0549_0844 [Limosilactobacillus vaginalis DSM 5837 = ATCC 49540]